MLALLLAVGLVGCGAPGAERTEKRCEQVLTAFLTCPDEAAEDYVETVGYAYLSADGTNMDEGYSERRAAGRETLKATLQEKYDAADFTDKFYSELFTYLYEGESIALTCVLEQATTKVSKVSLTPNTSTTYQFTAEVLVEKDDDSETVTVTGSVQVDEKGRVSYVRMDNAYEVVDAILSA